MTRKQKLGALGGASVVAALGFATTQLVTGGAENASSAAAAETEVTFTFTNVGTATLPTVTETTTVTVTTEAPPPPTTAPPPTTTTAPPTTTTNPTPSGLANAWVDTNGGSCAYSSSLVAYSDAAACSSFDAAWDKLAVGNTARVRAGVYPGQNVTGNKTAVTKIIGDGGVIVSGAENGFCSYGPGTGLMQVAANFLWLENVTIDAGTSHGQGTGGCIDGANVTYANVNLWGSFVSLYPVGQNFSWRGGELGKTGVNGGQRSCNTGDGEPVWIESSASGATLDGIRFNSMSASGAACSGSVDGFHLEYVRVQSARNVTISHSVFVDDAGTGNGAGSGKIFITSSSSSSTAANGLRLLNNTFGSVKGTYAIQTHNNVQNGNGWEVKNNAFVQPVLSPNPAVKCGNTGPVDASWKVTC